VTIDETVSDIISDLRRAASPGAIGDASERPAGTLVDAGALTGPERFRPSQAPLAVAIDGPGLFVVRSGSSTVYSRLGDFKIADDGHLVDGSGRVVLGYQHMPAGKAESIAPILVQDPSRPYRFESFRVSETGVVLGIERVVKHRRGGVEHVVPIAQLALALFPAPQLLARGDETTLLATARAGKPTIGAPGVNGRGLLRSHVVATGAIDLEADLQELWMLRRMREVEVALASAADGCTRTALGLVR